MKINDNTPFKKNAISSAICMGLLTLAPNAHALVINAIATSTLPAISLADSDSDTGNTNVFADTAIQDSSGSSSGLSLATASGNDSGWMFARAYGEGIFTSESSIQQSVEFTNTATSLQNYFFDFTINFGSLQTRGTSLIDDDLMTASNEVSIKLNGVEIFNSSAELKKNATGAGLTTSGLLLGSYASGSDEYRWNPYNDKLDLGIIGIGETFTLDYDITTFASSNVMPAVCDDGYGDDDGYGYGGVGSTGSPCFSNWARSQFGDPNGLSSVLINSNTVTSSSATVTVSEPSALLLLGGGIAGLAFSRRRKQRSLRTR